MSVHGRNLSPEAQLAAELAVMQNDLTTIKEDVADIKRTLKHEYITQNEFDPVKKVVYGLVGIILVTVAGAVVALVMRRPG